MKSEYYVATVVSAYRRRLDDILAGRPSDMGRLTHELDCVSHRPYCSGFYFGEVETRRRRQGRIPSGLPVHRPGVENRPWSGGNSSKKQIFRRRRAGGRHPSGDYRPLPAP